MRSLDELLPAALAAHQAGRLDEAGSLYEEALACAPDQFDALHMLGVVHFQRQDFVHARVLIGRALALRPDVAEAHRNLRLTENALRRLRSHDDYRTWIATVERRQQDARAALLAAVCSDAAAPRISVALPTYDSPETALRACLDSVLAQLYPNWDLCIADDASHNPNVRKVLTEYAARDARITIDYRTTNGHISAASNSAVALATGEFVALLDHDDALPPHALAEVALELREHPDATIVYTDEDKIDEAGLRFEPYFKPDWNPALLTAQNYVSHLGIYRTALVRAVGGFREGVEGAQDWDLLLRCAERVPAATIRHIPQILYHWRAVAGSTARTMESKHYAALAQERVVAAAFKRRGAAATIRRVLMGTFLEAVPVPNVTPTMSLIVLRAGAAALARWSEVAARNAADLAVVDVPAIALDGSSRALSRPAAEALNAAAARAEGDVLLFVDAACEPPTPDRVAAWIAHATLPDTGPVGALVLDARRDVAGGAYILDPDAIASTPWWGEPEGFWGMAGRSALTQSVSAVRIDAVAVRRDLWQALGGLDTRAFAGRYFDVDFGLRAVAAGRRPLWFPGAALVHSQTIEDRGTFAAPALDADAAAMRIRWPGALARDPAYNPNLARPPRLFELALR